ncbi:hypothetical protein T484DRAFT_1639600, partial [Baffinella frigidus]
PHPSPFGERQRNSASKTPTTPSPLTPNPEPTNLAANPYTPSPNRRRTLNPEPTPPNPKPTNHNPQPTAHKPQPPNPDP